VKVRAIVFGAAFRVKQDMRASLAGAALARHPSDQSASMTDLANGP
jgi:hypothetical protein